MKRASDIGDYEQAKEIRDTLFRLNNLRVRQKMEKATQRNPDEEYIGIVKDHVKGVARVMSLRRTHGVISDRKTFDFDLVGDNSLSTFLLQYYTSVPSIPRFVYVNEIVEDTKLLEASLERIAGHKVSIRLIGRAAGQRNELMNLVERNLALYVEQGYDPATVELRKALGLGTMPLTIDCFDVSNLGNDVAVGACCRFIDGKPDKSMYKRFKIETVYGQNDFAMMAELVRRRYGKTSEELPDLIVVDGGRGQLAAALSSLRSIGINDTQCVGLAKENEEIYIHGQTPLVLPRKNAGLKVLQHIRDEAHRFGLAYNTNLRKIR
jgi:excinuclease ABC subunit C